MTEFLAQAMWDRKTFLLFPPNRMGALEPVKRSTRFLHNLHAALANLAMRVAELEAGMEEADLTDPIDIRSYSSKNDMPSVCCRLLRSCLLCIPIMQLSDCFGTT